MRKLSEKRLLVPAWLTLGLALLVASLADSGQNGSPLVVITGIEGPTTLAAGRTTTFGLTAADHRTGSTKIYLVGGLVTTSHVVEFVDGSATFRIGPPHTDHAGLMTLLAPGPGQQPTSRHLEVVPGDPAGTVTPLVGQRTVIANGRDRALAVIIPTDRLGNVVLDGEPTWITGTRPDGAVVELSATTTDRVAWAWLTSSAEAGVVEITARAGDETGPVVELLQVPAEPVPFGVFLDEGDLHADGRSLVGFETGDLVDVNGNILPDGIAATVTVEAPDGLRRFTTVVREGRATGQFESPERPGTLTISMTIGGTMGQSAPTFFLPALDAIDVGVTRSSRGVEVAVGPLVLRTGGLVPDGTEVVVNGSSNVTTDGFASVDLDADVGVVVVQVLGRTRRIEL